MAVIDYKHVYETVQNYVEKYADKVQNLSRQEAQKLGLQLGVPTLVIYAVYKLFIYPLYLHPANRLPGPRVSWVPLMGNFLELVREEAGKPQKKWAQQYGDMYVFHGIWNSPRVVVTDPLLLKQILTINEYDYIKPKQSTDTLEHVLGRGLLTAEGDVHKYQRKMLNPAFSLTSLRALVPLMAKPGHRLRDLWMSMVDQDKNKVQDKDGQTYAEIEVSHGLSLATLDVIGWAFGQDFKSLENDGTPNQSRLSQAYLHIFRVDTSIMPILHFIFPSLRKLPTEANRLHRKYFRWLRKETALMVQAGIDRAAARKGIKDDKTRDLLAVIVDLIDEETGKGFTPEEIEGNMLNMLAAGHETTSVSLSWCLWLLAQHQDIQDQLRAEVKTLFQKNTYVPTYDEINSLPLLNNIVRETMRLIPAVPSTARVTRVPVTLGQYQLPKGTRFYIGAICLHHSKSIWGDDVEEFKPSRWETQEVTPYQYFPFLQGGRQCIGYRFALIEFKILLSILIRNLQYFEKPNFKISKKQQITWRPSPNMTLWVKRI